MLCPIQYTVSTTTKVFMKHIFIIPSRTRWEAHTSKVQYYKSSQLTKMMVIILAVQDQTSWWNIQDIGPQKHENLYHFDEVVNIHINIWRKGTHNCTRSSLEFLADQRKPCHFVHANNSLYSSFKKIICRNSFYYLQNGRE